MKDESKNSSLHPSSRFAILHPFEVVWLSLDEGDNDLARFFTYFIMALQNVLPGVGEAALLAFRSFQPPPVETLLAGLINEIAAETTSFGLVLDDYHLIKAKPIHQAMTFLLDHIPAPLHLVIATRTDPPLPLARLRGRRQLTELRAADLRFTTEETATFLNRVMGLPLSSQDVAALEARTEGWIVGLQLAALSLVGRDASRIPDFIAAFTGSHHYILDYLTEEVLQRQPEAVQTFLLYTSILDRLCGPLCDAVLERMNASREGGRMKDEEKRHSESSSFILHPSSFIMLEYLEHSNLFIIPLDDERRWYRYHHLFADLLRNRLSRLHPGLASELHRRASQWHERNGLMAEAVQHALAADDWSRAADLVGQFAWPLFNQGEMMTLLAWLTALPEELIRTRPNLCLYHAWLLVLTGRLEAVEPRLQQAEQHLPQPATSVESREMLGHVAAIRAYVASLKGEATHGVALARQALQYLPGHDLMTRSVINTILGTSSLLAGDVLGACQALTEAGEMARAVGNIQTAVAALIILAAQQMVLGRLHQAAKTLQTALHLTTGREGKFLPLAGSVYWGLSKLHYEWNHLEAATRYAEESLEKGKLLGTSEFLTGAPLALARVRRARGDLAGAYEAFQQADQFVRHHKVLPWDVAGVEAGRVWLWLAPVGGDLAAVTRWAEARENVLRTEGELPYTQERE
ncbi:MAG: helix-turn-helix transcriptional regulator, partial [Chloroflexota bacterium]